MDWLLLMIERRKDVNFSGVNDVAKFVNDFVLDFVVSVDLTLIVYSIAIKNIKNKWITSKIDEL